MLTVYFREREEGREGKRERGAERDLCYSNMRGSHLHPYMTKHQVYPDQNRPRTTHSQLFCQLPNPGA